MKYKIDHRWAATVLFAVCVMLVWCVAFPQVLSFHEQYQMFLYDWDYVWQKVSVAGGLAVYLGEFVTQFFYFVNAGAAVVAALMVAGQRLTWRLARMEGAGVEHYALTFLPPVAYMCAMMDVHLLMCNVVGCIMALALAVGYGSVERRKIRWALGVALLPVAFWMTGPCAYTLLLYIVIKEWRKGESRYECGVLTLMAVAYMVGIVCVAYRLSFFPLKRVALGIGYYRYKAYDPTMQMLLTAVWGCVPFVVAMLPRRWKGVVVTSAETGAVLGMAVGVMWMMSEEPSQRIVKYDYMVRKHDWEGVQRYAKRVKPQYPAEVVSLNLALGMRGELADRMFEYPQYGVKGLLPSYTKDLNNAMVSGELYYQLGLINTAQRLAFETQESIANNLKSGRLTMRLMETNMINGQYEVARRYGRLLQKTFAYREKASRLMALMEDENALNRHAEYGRMRRYRLEEDFYYTETAADQMLGLLFIHNRDNVLAFVYLMAYELENKNIAKFIEYYPLTKYIDGYGRIPRSYQEMIAYWWRQGHEDYNGVPWPLDQQVMREMEEFIRTYSVNKDSKSLKEGRLGNTLWNFLFIENDEN